MRGVEAAGWFQTAVALGLVGCILVIGAVILAGGVDWGNLQPYFAPEKTTMASIFTVTALAPWEYSLALTVSHRRRKNTHSPIRKPKHCSFPLSLWQRSCT